jgi:hypothetical protein
LLVWIGAVSHHVSRITHHVALAFLVLVIWSLVLGAYLEFGACDLVLYFFMPSTVSRMPHTRDIQLLFS